MHVRPPQQAIPPARAFAKSQTARYDHCLLHLKEGLIYKRKEAKDTCSLAYRFGVSDTPNNEIFGSFLL
jgi:hypothetical protein